MKKLTQPLVIHADNGHAWLAVKTQWLADLGIFDLISNCSYQKGRTTYLEEDDDWPIFTAAYEKKFVSRVTYKEPTYWPQTSPVRGYRYFDPNSNPAEFVEV